MIRSSVILLTHNNLENLTKKCLESLFENTRFDKDNILVIVDDSTDNTQGFLKSLNKENVHSILNKEHTGVVHSFNQGVLHKKAKYYIWIHNDVVRFPLNWRDIMIEIAENNRDIGIVSAREMKLDRTMPYGIGFVKWYGTNCQLIKGEMVDLIGLFDEDFDPYGDCVDVEYCHRALLYGYKTFVTPRVVVLHIGMATNIEAKKQIGTTLCNKKIKEVYKKRMKELGLIVK